MITKRNRFYGLVVVLLITITGCSPIQYYRDMDGGLNQNRIGFLTIESDTLFGSRQVVHLLFIPRKNHPAITLGFGYSEKELKGTSRFASESKALAAINAGFFDRDKGGNVCYFEIGNRTVSRTRPDSLKWAKSRNVANGALVLFGAGNLRIEPAQNDEYYEKSTNETAAMVAGPLLIHRSVPQPLPDVSLTRDRNPRTCIGITNKFYILAAIDGRSQSAAGMTLYEVQEFFSRLKCTDALNLDGGGSTTLWIEGKGIVNHPSDREGERPVSDAILIHKK